jgi:hypothetical protein
MAGNITVKKGAWKNLEFRIAKAEEAMRNEEWTILPGQKILYQKKYSALSSAIIRYDGGFAKFRIKIGQENLLGRWKDLAYTIRQARQAMQGKGWNMLPSGNVLNDEGYSGLASAISKYHGGFTKFRRILGQTDYNGCYGRWKNLDYTMQRAQEAMKEHEWTTLPCSNVLNKNGYNSLASAITKYHGGFIAFRIKLGQENPCGRWKDLQYAMQQAQIAMRLQGWKRLPGGRMLQSQGYSSLASAITQYHGGVPTFRIKLLQENLFGRWKDLDYAIQQAQEAMKEHEWTTLPCSNVLNKNGYSSLSHAISRYYGGFLAFRELLAKAQGQPTHKEHLENLLHNYLDRPDQDDNAAGCRVPA